MLSSIRWFLNRFKTLTPTELLYRIHQLLQSVIEKRIVSAKPIPVFYSSVSIRLLPLYNLQQLVVSPEIHLFGVKKLPHEIKDWSYDFFTAKTFPAKYSKDINIRNDKLGSAKHVWEYNRMLFLPQLALCYKKSNEVSYLNQIIALIKSWVEQNPYLTGINWYSNIEINIRLINWMLTWEILGIDKLLQTDARLKGFVEQVWIPSIYQHCKYSYSHPSLYSSANNHLISEYAGLFIATSKWKFKESSRWNAYAKEGLEREIMVQHSENGVNKEETAEYIQFITDFFLLSMLVADKTNNSFSSMYKDRIAKIFSYISNFLDIKGNFPKYGDEDDGRVFLLDTPDKNNFLSLLVTAAIYFNNPDFIFEDLQMDQKNLLLFGKEGETVFNELKAKDVKAKSSIAYSAEGHFFLKKYEGPSKEIYLHFDAAPLGFLSIAAHGHSDALSYILHVDGKPIFVDPGTYCYHTHPEWRKYFLSSLAHNTVTINNESQAKFIGPTLWHNHYEVKVKKYSLSDKYDCVIAEHYGYKKFKAKHTRKIEFFKDRNLFIITDDIEHTGKEEIEIQLPFHLHPQTKYQFRNNTLVVNNSAVNIALKLAENLKWQMHRGEIEPIFGWYSESFYKKEPAPVCRGTINANGNIQFINQIQILRTD